jgi:hypothetical protein
MPGLDPGSDHHSKALFLMDCRIVGREKRLGPATTKAFQGAESDMLSKIARRPLILLLTAFTLGACASSRDEAPPSAGLAQDDDAYCQSGGKAVGSPDYVYCRRERDAARNKATSHADQRQRDLADYMMSHPDHP